MQYSINDGNFNNWKIVSGATKQTYNASQMTGGGPGNSYLVQLITQHNDNGTITQKVVDEITIQRPTGAAAAIPTTAAKKTNKTQFYLLARVKGQNNDTSDYTMQFSVWNTGTEAFDNQGSAIKVPANGTAFHTYLLTLDQATYIYQIQGTDTVKVQIELDDNNGDIVASTQQPIVVQGVQILAPPGPQNGSLEFDDGTITVQAQPDSQFEYGWDLAENLVVSVEWSVQPSGMDPGTLDLQISWYNTQTQEWELLYEDTDASTSGGTTASKTADQCYNDSYQILASLAGATTIQDQKTPSPNYEYPDGTDTVDTLDPA